MIKGKERPRYSAKGPSFVPFATPSQIAEETPRQARSRLGMKVRTSEVAYGFKTRNADGSAAQPAAAFHPNTGWDGGFSAEGTDSSTNAIVASINGVEVARIDSTGISPIAPTAIGPMTSDRILGRDMAGSGNAEQLTVGGGVEFTGTGGVQTSAFTGDVTKAAGGVAQTIANDAVTFAKMQDFLANTIAMRNAGTTGDADDVKISALTEEVSPAAGDWLLMEESGGALRRVDVGNISGGGGPLTVEAHTGDDTLLDTETGSVHTNEGASATVTLTLPDAAAGLVFEFYVHTNQTFKATCAGADTIRIASSVSSAGGSASAAVVGSWLRIVAVNATEWIGSYGTGTWSLV